ncbi:Kiwa anti-phage protein KwaB-like domain-containing protein [Limnohabitans sp.]|uniref:Kiwa anti-phage protein KwaB-like domain-containing protein n=1 Tax=Limnohabitans sp. TaxID=1907725 RepID=UPI00286EF28C|nr:Kiwa anti-phage protein KwaB-like domain-containing protein [Limnohabitans sp.]
MYTLFAYTRDPGNRIVRFAVNNDVQTSMTSYLTSQVEAFGTGCEEVLFDGNYKPDQGEMLVIEEFEDLDNLSKVVATPLDVPVADPSNLDFDQIRALFFGHKEEEGTWVVYLQSFDRRRVISSAGFSIFHSKDTYRRIEGAGLTLDNKLAAKLRGTKLSFFSFFHIRQLFDMSNYYQEATDNDIKQFSELKELHVENVDALMTASDSWVRRKVWLVMQSNILNKVPSNDIKAIASEFSIPIEYVTKDGSEKIKLPGDRKSLKTLLRFLDEDYYKSPLSKTNYLTNSKRAV